MEKLRDLPGGRVSVWIGDITVFSGDAIVNAANSSLMGGGGVDGAIHAAAGPSLLEECRSIRDRVWKEGLPAGRAVATGAGRLGVRRVIHTVGPVWHGGGSDESELLASCYLECLTISRRETLDSVAFPAISTGVYGYPKRQAARVAFDTITAFLGHGEFPRFVTLVFYSVHDAHEFLAGIAF